MPWKGSLPALPDLKVRSHAVIGEARERTQPAAVPRQA